jgi:hypothetical protein
MLPSQNRTVSIGLLMETAQGHQELAEDSLKRLQQHTQGLDDVVRDTIRRTMIAELGSLIEHSNRTIESLAGLQRRLQLRTLWSGALLSAVPALLAGLCMWWVVPSPERLLALRAQQQQLLESMQRLTASGAQLDLRQCGTPARLCVRVDRHAPGYGEHADYLIAQGR